MQRRFDTLDVYLCIRFLCIIIHISLSRSRSLFLSIRINRWRYERIIQWMGSIKIKLECDLCSVGFVQCSHKTELKPIACAYDYYGMALSLLLVSFIFLFFVTAEQSMPSSLIQCARVRRIFMAHCFKIILLFFNVFCCLLLFQSLGFFFHFQCNGYCNSFVKIINT